MIPGANFPMWITFAVIAVAIYSFVREKLSMEITSIWVIVSLILAFTIVPVPDDEGNNLLSAERLLSGLAHPALVTILALLVIGQGLFQTGALDGLARGLGVMGSKAPKRTLLAVLLTAGVTSAFLNNTPVVVMFIPMITSLSTRIGINPSKTVMPLSFIAILGGMTTLIGSSTNLLVTGVAERQGYDPVGFFDFVVPGAILAGAGALYVLFVMPRLLTPRKTLADSVSGPGGRQFIAQIEVTPGHPLEGATPLAGMFPALKDMTVRLIQRDEHPFLPPFEGVTLQPGDLVIVAATRKALTEALHTRAGILSVEPHEDISTAGHAAKPTGELMLAEAVLAPGSSLIGRSIEQVGLRHETGCIVVGIQRRSRMIRTRLGEIRLAAGDVILVLGNRADVLELRASRDFLLLEWSARALPKYAYAARARFIFLATITAAATGLVPIVVAALAGAAAMVPAQCLNVRQAARAFDRRIYLLIGASIAMASALEDTGGAAAIANGLVNGLSDASPAVVASALFLLIAVATNFLSNHAAAALFTPIAIDTAITLGVPPMVFVHLVIFAANCSFATPMGYQTNLLVMGPGHYRFSDFTRAGVPLIVLIWIAYTLLVPWYYGLN